MRVQNPGVHFDQVQVTNNEVAADDGDIGQKKLSADLKPTPLESRKNHPKIFTFKGVVFYSEVTSFLMV